MDIFPFFAKGVPSARPILAFAIFISSFAVSSFEASADNTTARPALQFAAGTTFPLRTQAAPVAPALNFGSLVSWAPTQFPQYFHGSFTDGTASVPPLGTFQYRTWPATGNYVALQNGNVYIYGPMNGFKVQVVGALADFRCLVLLCGSNAAPIPVFPTSYENKNNINVDPAFPSEWDPSMDNIHQGFESTEAFLSPRSLSFGDFLQNGRYTAFVSSGRFTGGFPGNNPQKWPDAPGKAYFLERGTNGQFYDVTDSLVPNPADRRTCITTSYSIVADFNNDGKPDLYMACTGIDFMLNGVWTDDQASEQRMFLSQPDGTYKHVVLPIGRIYGHQATAFDIDGDGNVDIVTVDPLIHRTPFVLWGNGDGTFRTDFGKLPSTMSGKNIYGAVGIPIAGRVTLMISGNTPGSSGPVQPTDYGTVALQYAGGTFNQLIDLTPTVPNAQPGQPFGLALDHIYSNGFLYSYHVSIDYRIDGITRSSLSTGMTDLIYRKEITDFGQKLVEIFLRPDNTFGVFGAICNVFDPRTSTGVCAIRVQP